MNNIRGSLTETEFIASHFLHIRSLLKLLLAGELLLFLGGAAALALGWLAAGWLLIALAYASFLAWALESAVLIPQKLRRIFRKSQDAGAPAEICWDDEELCGRSRHGTGTRPWRSYRKVVEDEQFILLYVDAREFEIFPKRWFDAGWLLEDFVRHARRAYDS